MVDTARGHCWVCKKPAATIVPCHQCHIGEYCSSSCRDFDSRRHIAECKTFGPKKCGGCGKVSDQLKECACCGEAFYCDKTCQKKAWKSHKEQCNKVKRRILWKTAIWRYHQTRYLGNVRMQCQYDLPFYFGNSNAIDFLNLKENEWEQPYLEDDPCLKKEFFVLSVGCGDIRSLVNTIGSLPETFVGKVHVTMCDFDPFVMARNILLVYMMVRYADEPNFDKSFTTIWYSMQLSQHDYSLLDKALETLCETPGESLHQLTKGLLHVPSEEVEILRQVWKRWHGMECEVKNRRSIMLFEKRRKVLGYEPYNPFLDKPRYSMVRKMIQDSYYKYWGDGIFTETETYSSELPFYNPLFMGRPGMDRTTSSDDEDDGEVVYQNPEKLAVRKDPNEYEFVYCITAAATPFNVWNYVRTERIECTTSISVQYHNYISAIVRRAICFLQKMSVTIKMTTVEFHDLKEDPSKFDRIFLSSLTSFHEIHHLVTFFGPLLNRDNKYSAIVMEDVNMEMVSDPDGCVDEDEY
ncbi:uncharacterized protein [Amphiura filiformis]|uniref:uncharacterized protein n=1 Tax=Amphiura filiformis TaxID=82378 RepID=UPI003B20FF28